MAEISMKIAVDAPVEIMWSVVTDIERYPEFVKEVKEVRIDSRAGSVITATYTVELIKTVRYTLELDMSDWCKKVVWKMTTGDLMSKNDGGWEFEKRGEKRCEATYSADIIFGSLIPGSITNMLTEINLPRMVESFKKRAETMAAG